MIYTRGQLMIELTEDLARKINRASQILSGLSRAASKDCSWVRNSFELHSEILDLQNDLREAAAAVTGDHDLSLHLMQAHAAGTEISGLFHPNDRPEHLQSTVGATGLAASA
jgi:hypothetical protein